jgi:hypothetical protein
MIVLCGSIKKDPRCNAADLIYQSTPLIARFRPYGRIRSGWHLPTAPRTKAPGRGCRDFIDPLYLHHSE